MTDLESAPLASRSGARCFSTAPAAARDPAVVRSRRPRPARGRFSPVSRILPTPNRSSSNARTFPAAAAILVAGFFSGQWRPCAAMSSGLFCHTSS